MAALPPDERPGALPRAGEAPARPDIRPGFSRPSAAPSAVVPAPAAPPAAAPSRDPEATPTPRGDFGGGEPVSGRPRGVRGSFSPGSISLTDPGSGKGGGEGKPGGSGEGKGGSGTGSEKGPGSGGAGGNGTGGGGTGGNGIPAVPRPEAPRPEPVRPAVPPKREDPPEPEKPELPRRPEPERPRLERFVQARYRRNPTPPYPDEARRMKQEGVVLVRVSVSESGAVENAELAKSSGVEALDAAAVKAVRRWEFEPARRGKTSVASTVTVPVRFRLE